jgi:hypothetical protein
MTETELDEQVQVPRVRGLKIFYELIREAGEQGIRVSPGEFRKVEFAMLVDQLQRAAEQEQEAVDISLPLTVSAVNAMIGEQDTQILVIRPDKGRGK